jgi:hypothetical protein
MNFRKRDVGKYLSISPFRADGKNNIGRNWEGWG